MTQTADQERIQKNLTIFYSKLDLDCQPSYLVSPTKDLPESLRFSFRSTQEIDSLAEEVQNLKGTYVSKNELISAIVEKLEKKPLLFLFFMHLFRNIRFTNVELLHFMFDQKKLNDVGYYRSLLQSSTIFRAKAKSTLKRDPWKTQTGAMKEKDRSRIFWSQYPEDKRILLALFKKTASMYCDREKNCREMWLERVRTDLGVRRRVAEFLVDREDLDHVIENGMVVPLFYRNVATLNVEEVKAKRGKLGADKVARILNENGFVYKEFKGISTLEDLRGELELGIFKDPYIYTTEKKGDLDPLERGKVFDFVLCSPSGIQYVIETNYYTTAMSKIREVVENFKRLNIACKKHGYPLIYITDGVGWFRLKKPVEEMIEFDLEQRRETPERKVPFFMNIQMFRELVPSIKETFR